MSFCPTEIEDYCLNSSSLLPSEACKKIYDYTRQNVPMPQMLIGPLAGGFLGFLVRALGAKRILEVGCFTGYSALAMAEKLPEDGEIISLDIEPETSALARKFWDETPHGKKIRVIVGPALESLKKLQGPFDLVLIDADKENYPRYFEEALKLLSPKGTIVFDNALRDGDVLKDRADEGTEAIKLVTREIRNRKDLVSFLLPLRDGLLLVQRR